MYAFHLFAETRIAEISMQYRETANSTGASSFWIIGVILLAAFAIGGCGFYSQQQRQRYCRKSLLTELCAKNHINRTGTKLLQSIASVASPAQPGAILLSESKFDAAVKKAALISPLKTEQAQMLGLIRRHLFEK